MSKKVKRSRKRVSETLLGEIARDLIPRLTSDRPIFDKFVPINATGRLRSILDVEEIHILRRLLWLRHGHPSQNLHGDDGEMQCHACPVDFKRAHIEEIETRLTGVFQLTKDTPTSETCPHCRSLQEKWSLAKCGIHYREYESMKKEST